VYSVDTTGWTPQTIRADHSGIYLYPLYDALIHMNMDGAPEPLLAQSWELVEPSVLEMKLIEGWSFHDGEPFNADAVKANLEYSKNLEGGFTRTALLILESVEVVDEYTVRLKSVSSAAPLVGIMGSIAGMMMSPKALDDETQRVTPTAGSGAYRLVDYVPGQVAVYERVENYWDPDSARVAVKKIFISNDDNTRLNYVITGEADATFLRASMLAAAESEDLNIINRPTLSSYNVRFNPDVVPAFNDVRVRRALSMAVDRRGIGEGLLLGLCAPSHAIFPAWYWAGNPDIDGDFLPFDPEGARALLAEAGHSDLSFTISVVNQGVWPQIAEVVQANLAAIGVTTEVVQVEVGALATNWRVEKTIGFLITDQRGGADPSVVTADIVLPGGLENPGGFNVPELERLHFAALEGDSPESRGPIYREMMTVFAENLVPGFVMCHLTTPFATRPNVQDQPVPADGSRWMRGVSIAKS
jgi:peptide/nickel transport system substrate-binding protein